LGRDAIGAEVELTGPLSTTAHLFGETPSRIIISFDPAATDEVRAIAQRHNVPFTILGQVGGNQLRIAVNGQTAVNAPVADLESTWRNALSRSLKAEALVAS
jgi:phosphoribosylformylglycinamidine synthase